MKILLEPTGQLETFANRQFRVFKGKAEGDMPLQMIGMFRFNASAHMQRFVDSLPPQEGAPSLIIGAERLHTGVDERPTMANALREQIHKLLQSLEAKPPKDDVEAAVRGAMSDAYGLVLKMIEDLRGATR